MLQKPQPGCTEEPLFPRCDGHCRHCQGGSRALNSSSVPRAGEGKTGQGCGTTGRITAHLPLPKPALISTGISMGRIPGEPEQLTGDLWGTPPLTQSTNNGRNLDWETEVSIGEIVPWLVQVSNAVSIADSLTKWGAHHMDYYLKRRKLRVSPREFSSQQVWDKTKDTLAQVSQVIVCQFVWFLYISKNPTLGPSDSTAQADQQRAGNTEFFIFKSKLPIIKIREYQLVTL